MIVFVYVGGQVKCWLVLFLKLIPKQCVTTFGKELCFATLNIEERYLLVLIWYCFFFDSIWVSIMRIIGYGYLLALLSSLSFGSIYQVKTSISIQNCPSSIWLKKV